MDNNALVKTAAVGAAAIGATVVVGPAALATMAVGGAVGALAGAALKTTKIGKEMDKNLEDAIPYLKEAEKKFSKYLPGQNESN